MRIVFIVLLFFVISGCSGISKGVAEAVLNKKTTQAPSLCKIRGKPMTGVRVSLEEQAVNPNKRTKIIMVHGISRHLPGYSARFQDALMESLGLDVVSDGYKEIKIAHNNFRNEDGSFQDLGVLRVTRHTNKERDRVLLFYELTWSTISDPAREKLAFDNSGTYTYQRADVNRIMKGFFNETIPDILVYRGLDQGKVNASVAQAACWSFVGGWGDLPNDGKAHFCDLTQDNISKNLLQDDNFFLTHSLGSRITVDTVANAALLPYQFRGDKRAESAIEALKYKRVTIFMLSNQLPLLQIGVAPPPVNNAIKAFCRPEGAYYGKRALERLNLVAFTDPNDILSYAIPPGYADVNLDSRLCPSVTNVTLNIAQVNKALGIHFANPAEAHTGYHTDPRVIGIVADGIGRTNMNPVVEEKCRWIETSDD